MKNFFVENPEISFLGLGALCSSIMAFLRSIHYTRKRFALRLAESATCAMLTSATDIAVHEYFNASFIWSIPIGSMIGFLGSDFIHAVIVGLIEWQKVKIKEKLDE